MRDTRYSFNITQITGNKKSLFRSIDNERYSEHKEGLSRDVKRIIILLGESNFRSLLPSPVHGALAESCINGAMVMTLLGMLHPKYKYLVQNQVLLLIWFPDNQDPGSKNMIAKVLGFLKQMCNVCMEL